MGEDEGAAGRGGERAAAGWLAWSLAGLLRALSWVVDGLGLDRALAWGATLGRLHHALRGPRVARVRATLGDALPELAVAERERIACGVFVSLYQGLVELLALGGRARAQLLARVEVEGLEYVAAAARASASRGLLVVTAHLGNWELACAKVAAMGEPVAVVYRPLEWGAFDRALFSLRARAGGLEDGPHGSPVLQIPRGRAGLAVVRALEAGRRLLVLLDQNAPREEGVFVPFFGRLASTRAAPIALAVERGIPVVTAFIFREEAGRRHRLVIGPPLALEREEASDPEVLRRNVARATEAIEAAIRRAPEQWIWLHRRWRTQPRPDPPPRGSIAGAGARV